MMHSIFIKYEKFIYLIFPATPATAGYSES